MRMLVGDVAEAVAAGAEWNQPQPIAEAHQTDGALPAKPRRHARLPRGIVRPVVDLHPRAEAPPRGVRAVRARTNQAELALEEADAPARVDDPARGDVARAARALERHAMRAFAVEGDRFHAALVDDVGAELGVGLQQKILEASAVELKRRHRRKPRRTELDARRQLAVVAVRKKVAEPELLQLRGAQMRLEPQSLFKIMRADLDARFADLERRLGHRMRPSLGDEHAQRRRFHAQLTREASAGQAAAENRHIVVLERTHAATL